MVGSRTAAPDLGRSSRRRFLIDHVRVPTDPSEPVIIALPYRATVTMAFGRAELSSLRGLVNTAGIHAEIAPDHLDRLVLAVTEIATNAVLHGGGTGLITLKHQTGSLRIEIRDDGPGLPDGLNTGQPKPDALSGRGLWLARHFCSNITVVSSAGGVAVTMFSGPDLGETA